MITHNPEPRTQNSKEVPGGITGGATPVPIPNTEVKPSKADDTAAVRQWESRTLPGYNKGPLIERSAGLFYFTEKKASVAWSSLVLAQRAVEDSPRWTRALRRSTRLHSQRS